MAINKSTTGITKDSISGLISCTADAPIADPIKAKSISPLTPSQVTFLFLNIIKVAVAVPILLWNLFVPSTASGGIPLKNNAGTVSKPPPPAKVSRKPATMAVKNNNKSMSMESSEIGMSISFSASRFVAMMCRKFINVKRIA